MPKVPVYDKSKLPTLMSAKVVTKRRWKVMNREVKPREREILARLEEINRQKKQLRMEVRRLQDELNVVRCVSTFGKNTVKLYALRLQNDCWYIGMSYDVHRRFTKHSKGKGASWTKAHRPIEVHETRDTKQYSQDAVAKLEDDMTLEYALKYGSDKVRGGGYCQMKPHWPLVIVENERVLDN